MKKVKDKAQKWVNRVIKYMKNEPLYWLFVIVTTLDGLLLRTLTVQNPFTIRALLLDLAFSLLIGLLYLIGPRKKRFRKLLITSIILSAICVINSAYYNWYESFASISLLASSVNAFGVTDTIKKEVVHIYDFIYFLAPLILYVTSYVLKKKNKSTTSQILPKKKIAVQTTLVSLLLIAISSIMMLPSDWSRLTKLWNRESVVYAYGIYTYQTDDFIQSLQPKVTNIFGFDHALKKVTTYYNEHQTKHKNNEYTDILKGKNIIAIHAESFQEIAMNLTFNGKEVTPYVNKLAKEGIFFSNFYSEVAVGTSSDAEFTYATSMMPSNKGTVFVNYFKNQYVTIQNLLKKQGYNVYSMHGNVGKFWNRDVMHKTMGYDKLYAKESYNIDEVIGLGLSDKSFFTQSIPKIQDIKNEGNPYYITMIMLSNHTPFSDLDLMEEFPTTMTVNIGGTPVTRNYINNTTLGNYFRSVHYADSAIGEFIENLDKAGLLENTAIVIYGDHDARISKQYYDILYNYDPITDTVLTEGDKGYIDYNNYRYELDRKVPFIIWTKDTQYNTEVTTPTGMIDVLPTLGNMLGISSKYALGTDIFNITDGDNTVVFSDGSYLTDKIYYNVENSEIYSIKNDVTSEDYIKERCKHADDLIQVSNYIIAYDLIKEMEERKK